MHKHHHTAEAKGDDNHITKHIFGDSPQIAAFAVIPRGFVLNVNTQNQSVADQYARCCEEKGVGIGSDIRKNKIEYIANCVEPLKVEGDESADTLVIGFSL